MEITVLLEHWLDITSEKHRFSTFLSLFNYSKMLFYVEMEAKLFSKPHSFLVLFAHVEIYKGEQVLTCLKELKVKPLQVGQIQTKKNQ